MEMKREMTRESVLKKNKKKKQLEMEKGIDIPIVECVERLSLDWVGLALRNGFLSIFFFFLRLVVSSNRLMTHRKEQDNYNK